MTCNQNQPFNTIKIKTTAKYLSNSPPEKIACDIKGPTEYKQLNPENSDHKSLYIIVIIDIFSRLTKVKITNDIRSTKIINTLGNTWISELDTKRNINGQ